MLKPQYAAIIAWLALLLCLIISSSCKEKQIIVTDTRHDTITAAKSFYRHDTTHEACTLYIDTAARQMIINKTTVFRSLQTTKDTAKKTTSTQRQNAGMAANKTTTKDKNAYRFIITIFFFFLSIVIVTFLGLTMRYKRL